MKQELEHTLVFLFNGVLSVNMVNKHNADTPIIPYRSGNMNVLLPLYAVHKTPRHVDTPNHITS